MTSYNKLTIFEGPDGSGKTTAAREYAEKTNALYIHHGAYPNITSELGRIYVGSMFPAMVGYQSVVLDRCWYSEQPYSRAFRGGKSRLTKTDDLALEYFALRCAAICVLCLPPREVCLENWRRRRQEEYLKTVEQMHSVYTDYQNLDTLLPTMTYDYTSSTNELNMAVIDGLRSVPISDPLPNLMKGE